MTIPVRFARKPIRLDDVQAAARDPHAQIYDVEVVATHDLGAAEYDAFTRSFLADRWWLSRQGGWTDCHTRRVVAVSAPDRPTLYVDPGGSSYARYVGVAISAGSPTRTRLDREGIDPVRHARTWVRTARDVLAQPGRAAAVDHLLELGLSQIGAALANAGAAEPPAAGDPAKKPYSVLLLYPDWVIDNGTETYYAFVEAADPTGAVALARRQAVAAQEAGIFSPDDFDPLLVTEGHHHGQPLSND
jgi:hypothetical protein